GIGGAELADAMRAHAERFYVDLDQWGSITTSPTMETSLESVFAANNARAGSTKQVASAV
ncbi:MAG: hypothetical protein VX307_09015, partial [Chloroflexota bacterium]|nr:hypothetical protein [Chloroflexota bacterium]